MAKKEFPRMRRADRATDDQWIRTFLSRAPFACISVVWENRPYATNNTFVYDPSQKAIFMHTARNGHFRSVVESRKPVEVCVTVARMGRLLPADTAKELSVEYYSVVVFGQIRIVDEPRECKAALEKLAAKYFPHLTPGEDYRALIPSEVAETTVYRIDIEHWTGKQKKAGDDFPGAFEYKPPAEGENPG